MKLFHTAPVLVLLKFLSFSVPGAFLLPSLHCLQTSYENKLYHQAVGLEMRFGEIFLLRDNRGGKYTI